MFSVTIIAPGNANPARREWGAIIANSLQNVGINAKEVFLPWGTVYARVLLPDLSIRGKTFDQGGFDLQLVGFTPALFPISAEFLTYDSSQFAPSSGNYYLWANSTADAKIRAAVAEGYSAQGVSDLKAWEALEYSARPEIPIEFDTAQYATNTGINYHGWDAYQANIAPLPQFLSYGSKTSMVTGTTGDFEQMLPLLTSSYYDIESYNPVYDSLFLQAYPSGFPGCGSSCGAPRVIPELATGVTQSGNTLTYTLRSGVTFQDGVKFNANDVLYTFLAASDFNSGSAIAAALTSALGNDIKFTWVNGTTTELVNDNVAGATNYYGLATAKPSTALTDTPTRPASMVASSDGLTVTVTLGNFQGLTSPAAIFHPEFDEPLAILPMHYLNGQGVDKGCLNGKTTCSWASSAFNTAQAGTYTSNGVTFSGPFGTGPYVFASYDPVNAVTHLTKYTGYWNATGLQSAGEFTIKDYYVSYIGVTDTAIAALKAGTVDALDPQYHYAVQVNAGLLSFAKVYAEPNAGQQEVGVNMQHPILGTGKGTPKGTAAAAMDIRQAIDYLIPRQLIISQLLVNSAAPGDVPFAVGGYKDSSLTPRPYDPATAVKLLQAAGYGAAGTGGITFTTASFPSLYLGMSVPVSGSFKNPVTSQPYASSAGVNYVVILQTSPDNKTWTGVQGTTTDSTGSYYFLYTPTTAGSTSIRVDFTGYTTSTSGLYSQHVGGGTNVTVAPGSVPVAAPQFTSPVKVTAASLSSTLGSLATQANLASAVATLTGDLTSANNNIASLTSSVNSLNGQVSTLTTVAYGAIAVAIIVGIAGFVFGRRRQA